MRYVILSLFCFLLAGTAFAKGDQEKGGDPTIGGKGNPLSITRGFCNICGGGSGTDVRGDGPRNDGPRPGQIGTIPGIM